MTTMNPEDKVAEKSGRAGPAIAPGGSRPRVGAAESAFPSADSGLEPFLDSIIAFFTSLRLTVVCLVLGMLLVFLGTMAQVDLGLYKAQNEYFRSFFVYWGPKGGAWKIPVFPGGYLVGTVLVINLVSSHFKRFKFSRDKAGIWMVHAGLILLLLGQLGTDMLSRESSMHLRNGETRNYSESDRQLELAVVDTTDRDLDKVVAIPHPALARNSEIRHPELPFTIKVNKFYGNSLVEERPADSTLPAPATQGIGARAILKELPHTTQMDQRDSPSAVVEIVTPQGSLGTWLVSEYITGVQGFTYNNRSYKLDFRLRRYYKPYALKLLEFRHDVYPGTTTPKNFSSRVLLQRPDTEEKREVNIYMNNPLRYAGETYYQASFDRDDQGTVLQVVHNPSWLTPYFSCVLVGLGLVVHFMMHLLGFTFKRKKA